MKFTFALSVISDLKHLLTPENPLSLTYYPFMKQLIPPNNPPINPKQTMHYYPIDIDKIQQIKNNSKISILSVNIRSLNTNYDFISQLIDNCHQPNIILIQETWNPDKDKSIFENYNQPTLNIRKNRNGGGSGIWTHIKHKSEPYLPLTNLKLNILEISSTITHIGHYKLLAISVYRPPNTDFSLSKEDLISIIKTAESSKLKYIIGGDTNIDYLVESIQKKEYEEILNEYNLEQKIQGPTRIAKNSKTCIDHSIVKQSLNAEAYIINECLADHLPTLTCINHKRKTKKQYYKDEIMQNIKNKRAEINTQKTIEDLEKIDWEEWINNTKKENLTNDEIFNSLHSIITTTAKKNTQTNITNTKTKQKKPWISEYAINLNKKANNARKKYLKKPSPARYMDLYVAKKKFQKQFKLDKIKYYNNKFENIQNNPKLLWNTIDEVLHRNLKTKDTSINELNIDNKTITNPTTICEKFNEYFKNIATQVANKIPKTNTPFQEYLHRVKKPDNPFTLKEVTSNDVMETINTFKSKNSSGYDNLSPRLIKDIAPAIITPLTYSINSCLKNKFPDSIKIGKLTPLHKKNNPKECGNYRPISQQPSNSKIIEKVSGKQLSKFLKDEKIIHENQFGFLKNHATNHALMLLINNIETAIRKKKYAIVICCDLSKAFDCINTEYILPYKLKYYFNNIETEKFFLSFFHNRKNFVQIGNYKSKITNLSNIGTVQGASLSPIFYNIYSNCLEKATTLKTIAYADDSNFIAINENINTAIETVNKELIKIQDYMNCNKLSLNTAKTVGLVFQPNSKKKQKTSDMNITIGSEKIAIEKETKFLGITIDEKLSGNKHYNNIIPKIKNGVRTLQSVKYTLPYKAKLIIYHSLIHSHLNYCPLIWLRNLSKKKKETLNILQKKALRAIFKVHHKSHTSILFELSGITKIENICRNEELKIMVQYKEKLLPTAIISMIDEAIDVEHRKTRSQNNNQLKIKDSYFPGMLLYDILEEWNNCNNEIKYRSYPIKSYIQRIKKYTQNSSISVCNKKNCINCYYTNTNINKLLDYMF